MNKKPFNTTGSAKLETVLWLAITIFGLMALGLLAVWWWPLAPMVAAPETALPTPAPQGTATAPAVSTPAVTSSVTPASAQPAANTATSKILYLAWDDRHASRQVHMMNPDGSGQFPSSRVGWVKDTRPNAFHCRGGCWV